MRMLFIIYTMGMLFALYTIGIRSVLNHLYMNLCLLEIFYILLLKLIAL